MLDIKDFKEQIQKEINHVLQGRCNTTSIPMMPLDLLIEWLEELGTEPIDSECFDQNGWQVDFWQNVIYNDNSFTISGSLWYGDWKFSYDG